MRKYQMYKTPINQLTRFCRHQLQYRWLLKNKWDKSKKERGGGEMERISQAVPPCGVLLEENQGEGNASCSWICCSEPSLQVVVFINSAFV